MEKRTRCLPAPQFAVATAGRRCRAQKHQATRTIRECLGKELNREGGQALRRCQRSTVQAPDGCSSPDAAAAAALSSAAARQSLPQRQAKAAQAENIAAVYLQRQLINLCCSSVLNAREQHALACSIERCAEPWAKWPKGSNRGRAAGAAERVKESKADRKLSLLGPRSVLCSISKALAAAAARAAAAFPTGGAHLGCCLDRAGGEVQCSAET